MSVGDAPAFRELVAVSATAPRNGSTSPADRGAGEPRGHQTGSGQVVRGGGVVWCPERKEDALVSIVRRDLGPRVICSVQWCSLRAIEECTERCCIRRGSENARRDAEVARLPRRPNGREDSAGGSDGFVRRLSVAQAAG